MVPTTTMEVPKQTLTTCSVAFRVTSSNVNSENRETHGDRSSNDHYPDVGYFPHHSRQLNSPETETNSHMVTENYPHRYLGGDGSKSSQNCIYTVIQFVATEFAIKS